MQDVATSVQFIDLNVIIRSFFCLSSVLSAAW